MKEEHGKFESEARIVAEAIKRFAKRPDALDNMESYLSHHFGEWLSKYANTPADLACELKEFSNVVF